MNKLIFKNKMKNILPILQTSPFKEISPVIPTLEGTFLFNTKLNRAVVIAVPAEGPSLILKKNIKLFIFIHHI